MNLSRVFVVEDDPAVRKSFDALSLSVGMDFETFASSEELLSFFEKHPDQINEGCCLVIDVQLMGMSGIELYRKLCDLNWHLPTIFVTGNYDKIEELVFDEAENVKIMMKPLKPQLLLDLIEKMTKQD